MKEVETLTIKQVVDRLNIPASTVRFYYRHGLIPNVKRNQAGYRVFTGWQCDWIRTLVFLRRSGFSIRDLKTYARLCRTGNSTVAERKAMLATKKRQLWQTLEDLQENIDFIERREENFENFLQKQTPLDNSWM